MLIVALSGKMRSGKSTIAQYLAKEHLFTQVHFATWLKSDLMDAGFSSQDIADKKPIMRKLMQIWGQAKRELISPRYWIDPTIARLDAMKNPKLGAKVVIDDLRFKNEVYALKEWARDNNVDLRLVRVERIGNPANNDKDLTETDLDDYPFAHILVAKSGELDVLYRGIEDVLELK